ncbi:hypothetical protein BH11PSE4_BH11PSE4_42830 [soil metagenome]
MSEQKPSAGLSARERAEAYFTKPVVAGKTTEAEPSALLNRERQKAERLALEARTPTKLRKFVETLSTGAVGRAAYVTLAAAMPPAADNATWKEDLAFNAATAILASPGLKMVYAAAIKDGCAVTDPA